ncbi:hypothetical protein CPB85DRAFT_1253071 [Mucidula mucida]|nr:hypothetical protein CPB85DRAFT_1253071 [Mucidula mucida]
MIDIECLSRIFSPPVNANHRRTVQEVMAIFGLSIREGYCILQLEGHAGRALPPVLRAYGFNALFTYLIAATELDGFLKSPFNVDVAFLDVPVVRLPNPWYYGLHGNGQGRDSIVVLMNLERIDFSPQVGMRGVALQSGSNISMTRNAEEVHVGLRNPVDLELP